MDAIKANHATVEECLEDVVEQWLRDGDDPSWKTLAEAVTLCRKGGGKNVALKIKQETGIIAASVLVCFASIACLAMFFFLFSCRTHKEKECWSHSFHPWHR